MKLFIQQTSFITVILSINMNTFGFREKPTQAINLTTGFEEDFEEPAFRSFVSPHLQIPVFQHSRIPLLDKEWFSPKFGSGRELLPEDVKNVLVPRAPSRPSAPRTRGVNVLCRLTKMIVKVNKDALGGVPYVLKLGTCDISKSTKLHHLFMYEIDQCNTKRKLVNNRVTYSNLLHYFPVMDLGPVLRTLPFSVPVECHFNRYHYSYKIGYIPHIRRQHHFKPLRMVENVVLTPRDAQWRRLLPTEEYVIGQPMYFQADGPPLAADERLLVDRCFVTINSSHLSMPRFTVIENHGCMIDSKSSSWSKFIQSGKENVVRFSLDAFLFQEVLGEHLYLHCKIFIGSLQPTTSAKSCTYNQTADSWEELHSHSDVCHCCESTCRSSEPTGPQKVITSGSWKIESDLNVKAEDETRTAVLLEPRLIDLVQVLTKVIPDVQSLHSVPDTAVEENRGELMEPRKIFEQIFGLD